MPAKLAESILRHLSVKDDNFNSRNGQKANMAFWKGLSMKTNRNIKVYEATVVKSNPWGSSYKTVPQIRLQGLWLEELGFEPGLLMNVQCSGGKLVITRADEVMME